LAENALVEQELIMKAQTGDNQAFRQLVETYAELTGRLAETLLAYDRRAAEDALQEAWLDAWRGLARFQPDKPFRPWICKLVANRCRMVLRRRHFQTVSLDDLDLYTYSAAEDAAAPVLRAETRAEIKALLGELSPEHRLIMELRYFVGLEVNEIAWLTGQPAGTVKSRLHRTLEKLRSNLQASKQIVRD
jgi:RNA polymerase sigma-70 factor, ECF subfamily